MFDPWLLELIAKHARTGALADTNLFSIYCVGTLDPSMVPKFDGSYSFDDFRLLDDFLGRFDRIVTTPNIMTEVSNLATNFRKDVGPLLQRMLRDDQLKVLQEKYVATETVLTHPICERLGVADGACGVLADQQFLVLTNDLDLSLHLHSRGADCVHYDSILRPIILKHPLLRRRD